MTDDFTTPMAKAVKEAYIRGEDDEQKGIKESLRKTCLWWKMLPDEIKKKIVTRVE